MNFPAHTSDPIAAVDYKELAVQLHALAAAATDGEAQAELHALAASYERLANKATELADKYLPLAADNNAQRST